MSEKNLQNKVKELRELQRMAEELAAEISGIQDEIKAEMLTRGADEVITGEYKISWKEVISNRFDSKAFKEKYSDLYNQFTKTSTSKRFTIS